MELVPTAEDMSGIYWGQFYNLAHSEAVSFVYYAIQESLYLQRTFLLCSCTLMTSTH